MNKSSPTVLPTGTVARRAVMALLLASVAASFGAREVRAAQGGNLEGAEALIQRIANEVITAVKNDPSIVAGDIVPVQKLVDDKIMPHVNFARMTASAVGRHWRQATPAQRDALQAAFKTLLIRTYAGALGQIKDQTLRLKPTRARPEDAEIVVRTELRGGGDPIPLDYRMEKVEQGWKIYDLNVLGIWLVDTYRNQFTQVIGEKGIDGLIQTLNERNQLNAAKSAKAG